MRGRILLALASAVALIPSTASAAFHEVSIREVFPGDSGQADAEYVEFQAYASGQNFLAGHFVTFRNAAGETVKTETFAAEVPNGQNQMTFVMATPSAESRFGIVADEGMALNLIDPAGGAVCWEALDCVSWGGFAGSTPSPAGSPVAPGGIADGMAVRRTIAPGCATLLESSDDRNDSAVDFSEVFPSPRPNSVAPTERTCGGGGGGGPAKDQGAGSGKPQTRLLRKPAKVTTDRTPTFGFRSNKRGATFLCKVDGRRFRRCRSPLTLGRLSLGRHVFRVKARSDGEVDPTPAAYRFKVVRP